jgi:hypothetical protein
VLLKDVEEKICITSFSEHFFPQVGTSSPNATEESASLNLHSSNVRLGDDRVQLWLELLFRTYVTQKEGRYEWRSVSEQLMNL